MSNKINDHISEINTKIKSRDPNEDDPFFNDILASLKCIEEECRIKNHHIDLLAHDLQSLNE